MYFFLFNDLLQKKYPIFVQGNNNANDFIRWGNKYASNNESDVSYPDIIIYLPQTPINIQSYLLRSLSDDIFPIQWSVSGRNDNEDWTELSSINEYLCDSFYHPTSASKREMCNGTFAKNFTVDNPNNKFFHYLKFSLKKNSYVRDEQYTPYFQYTIYLTGFEVCGYYHLPSKLARVPIYCSFRFLYIIGFSSFFIQ